MTILKPAPVSTRQFNYDSATQTFVADMSDTNGFGRVYDDATDEGLTLVSTRPGQAEVVFVVTDVEYDAEREIVAWKLSSINSPVGPLSIILFND